MTPTNEERARMIVEMCGISPLALMPVTLEKIAAEIEQAVEEARVDAEIEILQELLPQYEEDMLKERSIGWIACRDAAANILSQYCFDHANSQKHCLCETCHAYRALIALQPPGEGKTEAK